MVPRWPLAADEGNLDRLIFAVSAVDRAPRTVPVSRAGTPDAFQSFVRFVRLLPALIGAALFGVGGVGSAQPSQAPKIIPSSEPGTALPSAEGTPVKSASDAPLAVSTSPSTVTAAATVWHRPILAPVLRPEEMPERMKGLVPQNKVILSESMFRAGIAATTLGGAAIVVGTALAITGAARMCGFSFDCGNDERQVRVGGFVAGAGYWALVGGAVLLAYGGATDAPRSPTLLSLGAVGLAVGVATLPFSAAGTAGGFGDDPVARGAWFAAGSAGVTLAIAGSAAFAVGAQRSRAFGTTPEGGRGLVGAGGVLMGIGAGVAVLNLASLASIRGLSPWGGEPLVLPLATALGMTGGVLVGMGSRPGRPRGATSRFLIRPSLGILGVEGEW